jgi:hypothetical protein
VHRSALMKTAGFFIYGGQDEDGNAKDDLHIFQFNTDLNREKINIRDGEYKTGSIVKIDMIGKKVVTYGKKPTPRYKHSAEVFKNYFIVHGGRNDQ